NSFVPASIFACLLIQDILQELSVTKTDYIHSVVKEYGDCDSGYCDTESHPPECRFLGSAEDDCHECSEVAAYEKRTDECQAGQAVLAENIFRPLTFPAFVLSCFFPPVQIPIFNPVHHDDEDKEGQEVAGNPYDICHEEIHAADDADRNDDECLEERHGGKDEHNDIGDQQ